MKVLKIIEQYNNFKQLGATEEIEYLKNKVYNLVNIKNSEELLQDFTWCANTINMFYDQIDSDFKQHYTTEEKKRLEDEF
jgi:hypothetical protein